MTLAEIHALIAAEVTRLGGQLLAFFPTEDTLEQFLGVAAWRNEHNGEGVTHLYSIRKHAAEPSVLLVQGHYMTEAASENDYFIVARAAARFFDETPDAPQPTQREINRIVRTASPAQLQTALRRVPTLT